ncbi:4'-phosphopantetheinyl transferase family protein [Streptomyces tsukubensis]|uniref:4'-phosphopantetheinyl transferase family protein n=1 Tax=Streptomyces tsukubensis TaxID=83656 RepID=UPI00369D49D9
MEAPDRENGGGRGAIAPPATDPGPAASPAVSPAGDGHPLTVLHLPGLTALTGRAHRPDGTGGAPAEDIWRAVMSPAEMQRAAAYRLAADRRQFQHARWLLRTALSRLAPVAPRDWEFTVSPHGKPAIHPRFGSDIEFSLSHSGGLCLLALTRGRPVGADIQHCAALHGPESVGRLVRNSLSPPERAGVAQLTGRRRRDAVVQLWTLKEAYAKAVGLGLRLPFGQIAFRPGGPTGIALQPTARVPDPGRWDCYAPPAPEGFRMALCAARPAAGR